MARIRARATRAAPELARRELAAYRVIRQVLSEEELVRAIDAGRVEAMIADLLSDRAMDPAMQSLRLLMEQTIVDAARGQRVVLPSSLQPGVFGVLSDRIIQSSRELQTVAIDRLKVAVRETVRQAVVEGIEAGVNPRTVAREVRASVGLSPTQERWVANFRRELETGDRAALNRVLAKEQIRRPDGARISRSGHAGNQGLTQLQLQRLSARLGTDPLPPDQVNTLVEAYRRRLLALNAEAHSRTIALQSQKVSQQATWEDLIARGQVDPTRVRRTWLIVGSPNGDGRNRPEHREMDGQVVRWGERYSNGQMVPGETDWSCRCLERIWLARGQVEFTEAA